VSGAAAAFKNIKVGDQALPIELNDLEGREHSLADYGKADAVLLLFWATWSQRSLTELADLAKFQEEYGSKGLRILAINVENQAIDEKDLSRIRSILEEKKISYPVLIDQGLKTYNDWGVIATPSTAIVNRDGIVKFDLSSYPSSAYLDMDRAIQQALGLYVEDEKLKGAEPEYVPVKEALLHLGLGKRHAEKGFMTKALPELNMAAAADSGWAEPHLYLGFVHLRMGNNGKAGESLDKASRLDPDRHETRWLRAYYLLVQEKVDDAIALLLGDGLVDAADGAPAAASPGIPAAETASLEAGETAVTGTGQEEAEEALDLSEIVALAEAGKKEEAAKALDEMLSERLNEAGFAVKKKKKMNAMERMKLMMQQKQGQ
jgi:peroxiredoxin